jgi:hypothetical protein
MLRTSVLGPVALVALLAAYPVFFIAAANPGQVPWLDVAVVTSAVVGAGLVMWALLRVTGKSAGSAAVAAGFGLTMFFSYGQFANWLDAYVLGMDLGNFETPNALDLAVNARRNVALAWGLITVLVAVLIARSRWATKPELVRFLGLCAAGLLAFSSLRLAVGMSLKSPGETHTESSSPGVPGRLQPARLPDIYFIVLDGYARQDVLRRYYAHDNAPFLSALRGRDFQVSTQASANYEWTFLSLASTLNMGYVQDLFAEQVGPGSVSRAFVYDRIRDNETARFLRAQGYEIVHVRSTWGATSVNPYADREVRCESSVYTSEFMRAVGEASWLGAFHSKAGVDLARCNLANFEALEQLTASGQPRFVFAHFVLPHHPYLFDRNGRVLRNAVVSNQFEFQKRLWEDRDSYRAQLEFVNRRVLETVDAIRRRSTLPPLILIVSDHGPGLHRGLSDSSRDAVRFANFGAYLLPGAPPDLMPATGSAVNQFRRILGFYFGVDLPALPDRHFTSSNDRPYDFRELPHEKLREWWTGMNAGPHANANQDGSAARVEDFND